MKLIDLYDPKLVLVGLPGQAKVEIFQTMAALFVDSGIVTDLGGFIEDLENRERSFSTGVGQGLAIPHGKSETVTTAAYAIATLRNPFLWDEDDDETTKLVVMLAVPASEAGTTHLRLLSEFAVALMDDDFRAALIAANDETDIRTAVASKGE